MPLPDLLRRLLTAPGPSGYETAASAVWREAASSFAGVSGDALGSSVARVDGTGGGPWGSVQIGAAAVIAGEPVELGGGRFASRSLDNRLGAYVALEAAPLVAERGGAPGEVVAVAAVQEEVGDFGGARTTVFALDPQVVLAVDVTGATDVPDGDPKMDGEAKLGAGPIVNRGSTISPKVFDLLVEAADADGIPYAVNVSAGATNTDMDAAYASRAGTATGLISIPTRYIHTPTEVAALADVDAAIRLVAAFAQRLGPGLDLTR